MRQIELRCDLLRDWWQKLEAKATVDRVRGRAGIACAASLPLIETRHAARGSVRLGGWKDHNTVLRCYMRPDEPTMRAALARRAQRRASAG